MKLNEIQIKIGIGKQNLKEISPSTQSYMVVMLGPNQYPLGQITADNPYLLLEESNFEPGQGLYPLIEMAQKYCYLKNMNKKLRDSNDKEKLLIEQNDKEMDSIQRELSEKIPKLEFAEPQCELRFHDLEIEQIQSIKHHPIVLKIGKTTMSPASIRIVIG